MQPRSSVLHSAAVIVVPGDSRDAGGVPKNGINGRNGIVGYSVRIRKGVLHGPHSSACGLNEVVDFLSSIQTTMIFSNLGKVF